MKKRKNYIKNLNFKRLSRELGLEAKTNHERINSHIRGKYLESDHYHQLMRQREVYKHPTLPISVIRTNRNKTIKIVDNVRCVELRMFYGKYPYCVFEEQAYTVHRLIYESYSGELVKDGHDIHHVNFNRKDYSFENLISLPKEVHQKIHKGEIYLLDCKGA